MITNSSLDDIKQFDLHPLEGSHPDMFGYAVESTAPINVEDEPPPLKEPVEPKIREVARFLVESDAPEVVISVHGYGTQRSDALERYEKIYSDAVKMCRPKTHIFFGYLWPSEKPTGDRSIRDGAFSNKIRYAIQALPILPTGIFTGGIILTVLITILLFNTDDFNWLLTPFLILSVFSFSLLLTLILLRLSTYFRDNYRATNFGVLDLVDLLRNIDQAVFEANLVEQIEGSDLPEDILSKIEIGVEQWQSADRNQRLAWWDKIDNVSWKAKIQQAKEEPALASLKRIKLSFIGHSMGCFIVTNTIRILSDVFDRRAIEGVPTPEIGRVFCLARLVLIAPDIPVESIMPRRANFLRSSLHRCEEAYVFCNEGDLALRLASTTANYFSFPAKTRSSGYRLGNITVCRSGNEGYGIVNLKDGEPKSPFEYLEIRSSDHERHLLKNLRSRGGILKEKVKATQAEVPVADLFTYFDCTDYVDCVDSKRNTDAATEVDNKPEGVVTFGLRKSALNLLDYTALSLAYFLHKPRNINVHGGYFYGIFSQKVIYRLAFLGFDGFLSMFNSKGAAKSLPFDQLSVEDKEALLTSFSDECKEKGIQVVLSPLRYQKSILGKH